MDSRGDAERKGKAALADHYLDEIVRLVADNPKAFERDDDLSKSASDALDGLAYARELRPLIRRGLIVTVPIDDPSERKLGNKVTWDLTAAGMKLVRERAASWSPASAPT